MPRQEETDRIVFALQTFRRQPRLKRRQHERSPCARNAAEQFVLADLGGFMRAIGFAKNTIGPTEDARPIVLEFVERARSAKTFDDALVDRARIDAGGEVTDAGKRIFAAGLNDHFNCLPADALQRGERVMDRVVADLELTPR